MYYSHFTYSCVKFLNKFGGLRVKWQKTSYYNKITIFGSDAVLFGM